jgi:hypothetical protein
MPARKPKPPANNAELTLLRGRIDKLVKTRQLMRKIKALDDALVKTLKATLGDGTYMGNKHAIEIHTAPENRLNTDKIRAEMGEEWLTKYSKTTPITKLSVITQDKLAA